jgi:hypothetical protein
MGKTHKCIAIDSSISAGTSEDSQNQGFLKFSGEKAAHGHEVAGSMESRKGLKSGEPFSATNYTNQKAKKGRNQNDYRINQ